MQLEWLRSHKQGFRTEVYCGPTINYIDWARVRGGMAKAIGLRVYKIVVVEKGRTASLAHNVSQLSVPLADFVHKFVDAHNEIKQHAEEERSWYFQESLKEDEGQSAGLVHYGTFGFESNLIDNKTKEKLYRRKITDIEEVPLFYQFWVPADCLVGLAAFQSFQGRSPITLVTSSMKESFERANKGYSLYFRKVMPNDLKGTTYYAAPVKKLRLIHRKVSSDLADRYFDNPNPEQINFEMVFSAKRNRSLGDLGSLIGSLKTTGKSIVTHEGVTFPEAVAEVSFGGRTRRVGVLGANQDAGVIDLSDAVKWGVDGHPTFASLKEESDAILDDIHSVICEAS